MDAQPGDVVLLSSTTQLAEVLTPRNKGGWHDVRLSSGARAKVRSGGKHMLKVDDDDERVVSFRADSKRLHFDDGVDVDEEMVEPDLTCCVLQRLEHLSSRLVEAENRAENADRRASEAISRCSTLELALNELSIACVGKLDHLMQAVGTTRTTEGASHVPSSSGAPSSSDAPSPADAPPEDI